MIDLLLPFFLAIIGGVGLGWSLHRLQRLASLGGKGPGEKVEKGPPKPPLYVSPNTPPPRNIGLEIKKKVDAKP